MSSKRVAIAQGVVSIVLILVLSLHIAHHLSDAVETILSIPGVCVLLILVAFRFRGGPAS